MPATELVDRLRIERAAAPGLVDAPAAPIVPVAPVGTVEPFPVFIAGR